MSLISKHKKRTKRRVLRVKSRLLCSNNILRISVFKSLNNIYGQVIDDSSGSTIVSCSTLELNQLSGDKKHKAKLVGLELAKKALNKGIKKVKFDRGRFLYHGRMKAFADGLREGGLQV